MEHQIIHQVVGAPKYFFRKERPSAPYGVSYNVEGKKNPVRRTFATKEERDEFAIALENMTRVDEFNAFEWKRWINLKAECRQLGYESPEDALARLASLPRKARKAVTLRKMCDEFIHDRQFRQDASKDYLSHLRTVLFDRFCATFGDETPASSISRDQLQDWIDQVSDNAVTQRNYRNYVRAAYRFGLEQLQAVDSIPTEGLRLKRVRKQTKPILPIDDAKKLFSANKAERETCALLALRAFAGIRAASMSRLEPQEIRLKDHEIYMPVEKFKTENTHLITDSLAFPNLWPWLERANLKAMCALDQKHQEFLIAGAFRKAGIKKEKNVMRYSALTYRCALDGHSGVASELAGHRQATEIWDSYKGVATKRDAQAYGKILP
ncbi:MAG: hypothetical protein AAFX93_18535 [Verrucomicrobiota bacterium]